MRNAVLILSILFLSSFGYSQNLFFNVGTVAGKNKLPNLSTNDMPHIGYRAGLDFSLNKGNIYLLSGLHYMQYDLNPTRNSSIMNHIAPLQSVKGRLGAGLNVVKISNVFALRTKVMGSVQYVNNKAKGLTIPDPYAQMNEIFMGIDAGVGISLYVFTLDIEYEKGITSAVQDAENSTFDFIYLTVGLSF